MTTPVGYPSAISIGDSLALRIFIPGADLDGTIDVHTKGRHRARVVQGKKPWVQFYPDKKTEAWELHAGTTALAQLRAVTVQGDKDFVLPLKDCRMLVNLRFNMRRPPSYPKRVQHHTKKPDVDNLAKAILDALVTHGVLGDDNCITDLTISKRYADEIHHPVGVEVDLTCLPE